MSPITVYHLRKPAKNRGVSFEDLGSGKIKLDGNVFEFDRDAEDYLMTKKRTDI